ncbi:MAG: DEAD/DEAH box helicase family protein [Candidatus Aureabacteria bacterium]|nr:DEAD/DEAH box helicase family protein [Candidatus Auribacterota bacterium]
MNEAETRAELIDPKLKEAGWGVLEDTKVYREFHIAPGKIQVGGGRLKPLKADYVLSYKGQKLAVVEAKSDELEVGEGVGQAKEYAEKLHINCTYASNGKEIYQINMETGEEGLVDRFLSPDELWTRVCLHSNEWLGKFNSVPFEDIGGTKPPRFYQEIAVNKVLNAVADGKDRMLLTLATGTGKTHIAFQIAWKLFQARWNLKRDGARRPRILFLADRNILADQAFNAFSAFQEDALVRIAPDEIRKRGRVPTNGNIFFTIFQTFMSGYADTPYFGDYPKDYFDFIIIDECHRGGANDESSWRDIMEYFSPAVQLGLTATPKRKNNIDTYRYFGEPVYIYSLKEGINDGFLTPFRVKRIKTTLDEYVYTPDDTVLDGEVEEGKIYEVRDFNKIIEIREREEKLVKIFLSEIDQKEKTLVFCANQAHAALIRDLINQQKDNTDTNYCHRVTANDGALGEQHLRNFQDNEKSIPTILTTSHKLSTGVDARNIRNIILLRPIRQMIEFKQIVGRGTRLFDGKEFFTIYDYVDAYHHFFDPEWDGEPIEETCSKCGQSPCVCIRKPSEPCVLCGQKPCVCEKDPPGFCPKCGVRPCICVKKVKIKLRSGKEREIQHMVLTTFYTGNGKPISVQDFLQNLYGELPNFFKTEDALRKIWSKPSTRKALLASLADAGYSLDNLISLQKIIHAEKSDLFDVLEFVAFSIDPLTREERVDNAKDDIFAELGNEQKEFLEFVLSKYVEIGVEELDDEKLPSLLELKYHSLPDAMGVLGTVDKIRQTFILFQKYLYKKNDNAQKVLG